MAKDNKKPYEPISKEEKTVNMVLNMFKRAEQAKAPYVSTWKKCKEAYKGEMDNEKKPEYKSDNVSNYIFSTLETIRPIMVAENPKFQVLPRLEKDFNKSYRVQQALDYEWTRTKMDTLIPKAILPSLQIGTSIIGLFWNGEDTKIGNVEPKLISAFNFFPDPSALTMEDADYVIYASYQNVGKVIRAFPEKAEELKMQTKKPDKEDLIMGQDSTNFSNQSILVLECYMRDYEMVTQKLEEDGEIIEERKMKYPKGRRIIIAGETLLSDGENPYNDGKFPFIMFKCYDLEDSFWGMGEVEQLIKPQKHADNLTNQIIDNARLTANCQWIKDKNAGIEQGKLTNRPGLIVTKNPGTEVRREQPPSIPAYVQNTVEMLKRDIEVISGVFDITRGERPASITSGVAINQLTQSAQSRIKLKMKYLENSLAELGSMWVNRIIQFWKLPRQLRVMVSIKDFEQATNDMNMQGQQFAVQPPVNGQVPIFTKLSGEEIDGDWDISVVGGSTMPVNKNTRLQQLISLSQTPAEDGLPMVDRQTILENSELPNVEEILARFEAIKQQQAEQSQAQQQSMLQEQQANIQMSAQAEMQKAQQKHQQTLELEQLRTQAKEKEFMMKHTETKEENKMDREMQLVQMLMNMLQQQNSAKEGDSEQKEENTNNINNENVEETGNAQMEQEAQLQQIIEHIMSLPPEEQQAILEQYPELVQVMSLMQGTPTM